MHTDPNSFDAEIKDAQANPSTQASGTDADTTVNTTQEGEPSVDYQTKFAESSKEALRLYEENKKLQAELAAKATAATPAIDALYPGFEQLSEEEQKNLANYTNLITKRTKDEIYKDPMITHARELFNRSKFEKALNSVIAKFPDLSKSKDEFSGKYFNPNNTPDNIEEILVDLAKAHLFDKAVEIGAEKERSKQGRVDLERTTGGTKTPTTSRSLEDWARMAQSDPQLFAQKSQEYQADLESGKLRE